MIDVVFLLLVFFMLAARFGTTLELPVATSAGGAYEGPPRLVEIAPDRVLLNGRELGLQDLVPELGVLMQGRDDSVLVQPAAGSDVQRLVEVLEHLAEAGLTSVHIVEEAP